MGNSETLIEKRFLSDLELDKANQRADNNFKKHAIDKTKESKNCLKINVRSKYV